MSTEEEPTKESTPLREKYIPFRRAEIVEMCLSEGRFDEQQQESFRKFCDILNSLVHVQFHQSLEEFKDCYAPYNPDLTDPPGPHTQPSADKEAHLYKVFEHILERANYETLPQKILDEALEGETLVKVKTTVDMDDFDKILCFYRGDVFEEMTSRKFLFRKVRQSVDVFQRVAMLIKFKDEAYHDAKDKKKKKRARQVRNFEPGKAYLFFYKNIPKYDLELLFPNVTIEMNRLDKFLFSVPLAGTGVMMLVKVVPQLLIILGVILFFTAGQEVAQRFTNTTEEQVTNTMPLLTALLAVFMALGGFAFKLYSDFTNKKIKFHKMVTDTLFFRNLDSNLGVINRLTDLAEEEETKEMILVYYHLLTHQGEPLHKEQLDRKIEQWMEEKLGVKVDFDIDGPLNNLSRISAPGLGAAGEEVCLLETDTNGEIRILSLQLAKAVIDHVWDHMYDYE